MAQDQADIAADGSQIHGDHFLSIDSIGVFYPAIDPKSSIPVKYPAPINPWRQFNLWFNVFCAHL